MSATRACLGCRARKVKCVPGPLRCTRCTAMGIEDCVYDHVKKRGIGKTLRMGEACKRCRTKKKKCDAKRPCTTCVLSKSTLDCVYDDEKDPQLADAYPLLNPGGHKAGRHFGSADPVGISTIKPAHAPINSVFSEVPSPNKRKLTHFAYDSTWLAADESHALRASSVDQDPHSRSSGHVLVRRNSIEKHTSPDIHSFIPVSSIWFPTIPPEPWIPLSFQGGEKLQVQISEVAASDLDMRSRLWLMVRLLNFGIYFSSEKLDALLRGDQSGTVVGRSFVCGSHVLGMMSYADMDVTPAMVLFHARRIQTAWESHLELLKGNDHSTIVQASVLIVSSHIYMRMPQMALLYVKKTCDFIKKGGLQFIPTCGRPPELSEDLHETLAALSQAIYWANYLFLMCGGPEPRATANLEKEFRQELPQTYPILFKICPLIMRTRGILFVRDVIVHLNFLSADGAKLELWRRSCDQILALLEEFSRSLLDNMQRFNWNGSKSGVDVISSSYIACLAHLAILSEAVGRADSVAKIEMDGLCDSALQRLGKLTCEHHFDEYTHLDLLLGDSWKKSLPVFDVRIANLPSQESASLRHFRRVIEEKYSDFRTGLPDCEPPIIFSLATMEDGTTDESRYPNLMSADKRAPYGI